MFKITTKIIIIGLFSVLSTSCRVHYAPSETSTPMLYEKNHFIAAGSFSGGLKTTSLVFNTAYAISNNIGIGFQHSNYGGEIKVDQVYNNTLKRNGYYDELFVGYFTKNKTNNLYEIYLGFKS